MLDDLQRKPGRLAFKMTDLNAFRLGENIATTPGKVVRERVDAADPVRAEHGQGVRAGHCW